MNRWLRFFTPAPGAATALALAGGALGLGLLGGVAYGLGGKGGFLENFSFIFGVFTPPFVAGFVILAALIEKKTAARAACWGLAAGVWLIQGLFAALGLALSTAGDLPTGLAAYCMVCLPAGIVCLAPAIFFGLKARPEMQAVLSAEAAARAVAMIQTRGEVTFAELAAETGVPIDQCDDLVEHLLESHQLDGWLDAAGGRVYTQATLRAKQTEMLAVVQARGQVTFDELAAELRVPRTLLRDWVYQAVERGAFKGYLNWQEGRLYSVEAGKLGANSRCPHCGGDLTLAGQGVIQCAHCGSEIFR